VTTGTALAPLVMKTGLNLLVRPAAKRFTSNVT